MPYFAYPCPQQPQQQQHRNTNALDPILQVLLGVNGEHAGGADGCRRAAAAAAANTTLPTPTPRQYHRANRAFSPRFDVLENDEAFHLFGDLPGVSDKKTVGIEFSDHRTMLVTGRVQRAVPEALLAPKQIEEQPQQHEHEHEHEHEQQEKRRSLNPTVEDTDDEDDFSVVSASSATTKAVEKKPEAGAEGEKKAKERDGDKIKTWLSERTFGTFQRTFSFPSPVSLETVTAKLEDGVLHIVVPKVRFSGVKKIEID